MFRAFPHAVASFEPTASGVLLWTRLGDGATEASWIVARDAELRAVVASGTAATGPDEDFTIVVDVDGLMPATTYWYCFSVVDERSPIGRTRTLPAGAVDRFSIGTVCCAHFAEAPLGVYRAVAEREVDLVVHLGDYIYEEAGAHGHRTHDPPRDTVTLDDYRRRLAQVRADPDAQALHLRHPVVAIWDDHDFCDNAWRDGAKRHDPAEHGEWSERVRAATRARQEWVPMRRRHSDAPLVAWRSVLIGDIAELILLDTRLTGRDRQAGDEGAKPLDDPDRSLLGDEQRRWLAERIADDRCDWSIVVSSVVVNELELRWPPPLRWMDRLTPSGYAVLDGRVMHDDQWDGYPAERAWLVDQIRRRADGGGRTVILSGDVHSSWAFEGPTDAATGAAVAVEFTTPAVSSAAMGRARYPLLWRLLDHVANRLDHVVWCDVTNRGYTVVDITAESVTSGWWFVHPYDDDPTDTARRASCFSTTRDTWPPRLAARAAAVADPVRAGLPDALPARPDDLRRIRRRRRVRVGGEVLAAGVVVAGSTIAAVRHIWRRSR